jgi:hypothetical protein
MAGSHGYAGARPRGETQMSQVQKRSRVAVVVDAPVQQVWDVIVDVTRVGEWSHECRTARWLGGARREPDSGVAIARDGRGGAESARS